jgi:hypothetical protein
VPAAFFGFVTPAGRMRRVYRYLQNLANFGVILLVVLVLLSFVFFVVLAVFALVGFHLDVLVLVLEILVFVFRPKRVLETHELLLSRVCSLSIEMMHAAK